MRKNLLKLVRVKEFAPEAQFQDPCASFTLPNVICRYCIRLGSILLIICNSLLGTYLYAAIMHISLTMLPKNKIVNYNQTVFLALCAAATLTPIRKIVAISA